MFSEPFLAGGKPVMITEIHWHVLIEPRLSVGEIAMRDGAEIKFFGDGSYLFGDAPCLQ
jgi:hypothetical protein